MSLPGSHPILDTMMGALRPGGSGKLTFAPDTLSACQADALAVDDGAELYAIVREMVGLASFLEERGSLEAAEALTKTAAPVIEKLDRIASSEAERKKGAEAFEKKQATRHTSNTQGLSPARSGVSLRKK